MLFNNNESGKVLTDAEIGALVHDNQLEGFLTKSDVALLLNQPDCVGIRIYLAIESTQNMSNRVVAVGIHGNGVEINSDGGAGYRMSLPFDGVNAQNSIKISRTTAVQNVQLGIDEVQKRSVSGFFSADSLQQLLEDKQGSPVAGIGFYLNQLNGTLWAPIGASFVSNNGAIQRVSGNSAFSHIQTTKPCPGFCAVKTNKAEALSAESSTSSRFATTESVIYLVKWDK